MNQSATIIIGRFSGATVVGPGSLRMARSAAKGAKSVVRFTLNGVTQLIAFDAEGFSTVSFTVGA